MRQVAAVLESLRQAGLTANPKKCAVGRREVRYLGYHLGGGQVRPQVDKTAAIAACPRPKTKKEVRRFLGLAGYYRRFIPNFAELTSPLTDLTRKGASDPVQWTEQCQESLERVKQALCGEPLLHTPNFSLPFVVQADAEGWGPSCPSGYGASTARWCTSAGSCPKGRPGTAPWRGSAWPSGGRSMPCGITCWGAHSPSARTTLPSSGSTA